MERRTTEEIIQTAYLLGWSADWDRMKRALDKRYKRLQDRKFAKRRAVRLSAQDLSRHFLKLLSD